MANVDLETLAMRAIEVTVMGRDDPRLLVATKGKPSRPLKIARLLAGLSNAADGRQALLLLGVRGREVHGLDELPGAEWWDELEDCFPGAVPRIDWVEVEVGGAHVLAIAPRAVDELIPAYQRGTVIVPWFDKGGLRRSRPKRHDRQGPTEALPTAVILGAEIKRAALDAEGPVDAFSGQVEIELSTVTGVMPDKNCSATLLIPNYDGPVELDVQVYPAADDVGVFRHEDGIEIRSTFRARLYLAGAVRSRAERPQPASMQLVVSLLLPGRGVPELRSLLLASDGEQPERWLV